MSPPLPAPAPVPAHEDERLAALREYGIEAALADPGFDRIARLAATIFEAPIALVSLVEEARQIFAAAVGTQLCETDRSSSFCAHALASRDVMIVPDTLLDPRFAANSLVLGPPFVRFYAGSPLAAPGGHVLGTLCIIDTQPRAPLTETQQGVLRTLGALVMDKLEMRRLELARQAGQSRFEKMAEVSPDAIVCLDERARVTYWNPAAQRLSGYAAADVIGRSVGDLAPAAAVHRLLALAKEDPSLALGHTAEIDIRGAGGASIPVEVSASVWHEHGRASFCAVLRDATERRRNEARLYRLAHIDALTDLPNRTLLRTRMETELAGARPGCLMMIDLDGFKDVNDGFGHAAGDQMLAATAQRLQQPLGPLDTVARMGGDEFAVFLPGLDDPARAARVADALIESVSQPVVLEGEPVSIGASVGIALYPHDGASVRELLSSADLALYEAKSHGKQCHRFFSPRLREAAIAKQAYQTELPRALELGEWTLHYQPLVRLADGALAGAEAALRWNHPDHGLLRPQAFMPALQSSPLAARVGHWMLATACAQLAAWRLAQPGLRLSVALLDAQFRAGDLAARVREALAREGLPAQSLELSVTETILLRQDQQTLATLAELRAHGVSIAMARYGTGRTSLDLVKRAPLDRLKIDASFVHGMHESTADAAIIRVILYLGRSLALAVTAEGVDTQAQAERLRRKGCEEAQGLWFGEPVAAGDFLQRFAGLAGAQGGA